MHHNIAQVNYVPAFAGFSFCAGNDIVLLLRRFTHCIREAVKHPIAGAGTDDEIIGKNRNLVNIQEQDIFPLMVF